MSQQFSGPKRSHRRRRTPRAIVRCAAATAAAWETLELRRLLSVSVNYSIGGFYQDHLGSTPSYPGNYDVLSIGSRSGGVSLTNNQTLTVFAGNAEFDEGPTAPPYNTYYWYSANRSISASSNGNSASAALQQQFYDYTSNSDSLHLYQSGTQTLNLGPQGQLDVTLLSAGVSGASGANGFSTY